MNDHSLVVLPIQTVRVSSPRPILLISHIPLPLARTARGPGVDDGRQTEVTAILALKAEALTLCPPCPGLSPDSGDPAEAPILTGLYKTGRIRSSEGLTTICRSFSRPGSTPSSKLRASVHALREALLREASRAESPTARSTHCVNVL